MKNFNMKILLMPLVLVLAVGFANAALLVNVVTDEFSVESPYPVHTVKECECGTRAEIIEVTNLGDFDTLFTVQVFSPLIDYITLSHDTFTLKPGESTRLNAYINAPCDTSISSYYIVKVSTNYGRSKELYKEFESRQCQNIKFTSRMLNETVNPGQEACIEIDLQNVGSFKDTFRLAPTANLPYAYASRESVELEPNENTRLTVCTKLPIEIYGPITQPFLITSDKARNNAVGSEKYEILRDYDFTVKTDEFQLDVCEDITSKSVLTFENLAGTPNEYYLSLRGPSFVNLSQYSLTLAPHEEDSVTLSASPKQLDIGEYEVTLRAATKYGGIAKDKVFKLNVKDCFETRATLNDANAVSEKACCGEKEYTLNIVNKGIYEETYQVIVDSEGWVSVDKENEFVRLNPAQQVNIPIKATLPCVDSKKASFVQVKQLKAPYQVIELKLELESLSQRACYNVELVQQSYEINYEATDIPLLLQHTGLKGGKYSLKLGELDSKFVALVDKDVVINPGELAVVHVKPENFQNHSEGNYLNKLTLLITPAEYDEIDYDRQFWVVLKDKGFLAKAWDYLRGLNYTVIGVCGMVTLILLVVLVGLLVFVVYLKRKAKIKRVKVASIRKLRVANMVLVGLLLCGLLVLVFLGAPDESRFFEEPSNMTTPLFHEWKQNTAYVINLDQYFTDPDADMLTYTATQPDHIQVKIDGGVATLTPEHGWSGTEYVVFTANDAKGGVADSSAMTLHVMKRKPMSWVEYWSLYCKQVNITLMMLILLVVLMATDIFEEKGYRQYQRR